MRLAQHTLTWNDNEREKNGRGVIRTRSFRLQAGEPRVSETNALPLSYAAFV